MSRRGWVTAVVSLAVITGLIAVLSTWVKRQALDTHNWTNTSSQLLANPKIQTVVGTYVVNELFSSTDVEGQIRSALPKQAQAVAGPAASGLQELAVQQAPQFLARPRVQAAWRNANAAAHKQLIRILDGGGATVSTANGEVVLNLHSVVNQLAASLGLEQQLTAARGKVSPSQRAQVQSKLGITVPQSSGQLVILRSGQLKTAQDIAKAIRHVSIIFTIVSLGLFALAVYLARGWRRLALRTTGWCFVGIGVLVLLVRRAAGDAVVNDLVNSASVKPAAHDAWNIGTGLLRATAIALVIYGLLLVISAWLAGSTRPAVALRRALTPTLRDHPLRVYASAGLVYMLVLLWGPTPALRHVVPALILAALIVLGIETVRRQAAREFPEARVGDAMRRLRRWNENRRGRGGAGMPAATNGEGARLEQLERLASLHNSGALTDQEYSSEKESLLRA